MKLYVSDTEEFYKDTIIGHLVNSGTTDLLFHIVQCLRTCSVNEENWALYIVLYCSHMMYEYNYCLGFSPIKHNEEGKYIHNEIFNNIPHFIRNRQRVDFLQDGFVVYN